MKTAGEAFSDAAAAFDAGDLDRARRLAKGLAAKQPGFSGAFYLLGLIAGRQGNGPQAVHHLTKAVALAPTEPAPRLQLAAVLEQGGRPDRALVQYEALLDIVPGHAEAHARAGAVLLGLDETERAAAHFRAALAVHDDWAAVLNNLGLAEGRLGQGAEAARLLTRAVAAEPEHAGYRINLANALLTERDVCAALIHAAAATDLAPEFEDAWITLGLVHQAGRDWNAGAVAFARALDLDDHLVSAHWCLAECLRALGLADRAARHYELALALDPEDRHGARLGLALVTGGDAPDRAPEAYVRQLFDDFAADFDRRLVDGLDYRAPALLGEALTPLLGHRNGLSVIDLGCGTGLAAPVLKPWAVRLDGIDLSGAMLDKARERGDYDDLTVADITAVGARACAYDLAVAADVLVYVGELAPIFQAVHVSLKPQGLFAFTVERGSDDQIWTLGAKARYGHGKGYIETTARTCGFAVAVLTEASTRSDGGQPVPGFIVVLQRQ